MTQPVFDGQSWRDPDGGLIDVFVAGKSDLMATSALERVEGGHEDDNEWCAWVEYRLNGQTVHRSVRLHLKTGLAADGLTASFA